MGTAARTLQRAGDSEWVERLGRIGLLAKGVSFAIVGVLALLVAFGAGGAATDRQGAFRLLSEQSYGFVALLAIAFGFGAYAIWRRRSSTVTTRGTTSRAGRSARAVSPRASSTRG